MKCCETLQSRVFLSFRRERENEKSTARMENEQQLHTYTNLCVDAKWPPTIQKNRQNIFSSVCTFSFKTHFPLIKFVLFFMVSMCACLSRVKIKTPESILHCVLAFCSVKFKFIMPHSNNFHFIAQLTIATKNLTRRAFLNSQIIIIISTMLLLHW